MGTADASAQARLAARARWGTQVVDRAVATVVARHDELDEVQRAQLREIAGDPAEDRRGQ